jgi:undecaprenyl-diphosphatase
MSLLEALILGIVQGLTEFLPISSTAHLLLTAKLLRRDDQGMTAFTAIIQLGTLLAVLIYFRADIVRILHAFWVDVSTRRFGSSHDAKMAWMIAAGTIPVVICGITLKKFIKDDFRTLTVIGFALIGFALLLMVAEIVAARRARRGEAGRDEETISWRDALLVGCFQALALVPGASRSGVTITAGLFAGLSRSTAARFSFLLSLPSVFAAAVKEIYDDWSEIRNIQDGVTAVIVASIVSGIVGYASIAFLIGYLKKHSTYLFIIYRIVLGVTLLLMVRFYTGNAEREMLRDITPQSPANAHPIQNQ